MNVPSRFKQTFNELDEKNVHLADELYSTDIHFADPFHEFHGIEELKEYLQNLYDGVESCKFDFKDEIVCENQAALPWVMHLKHRRFKEVIEVPGCSIIHFNDKVFFHRDYFDAGNLLYENVPLLGGVIRKIKARL